MEWAREVQQGLGNRSHVRVNKTDESSTLLDAYRTAPGLKRFSPYTSAHQLISSELCHLHYNHYIQRRQVPLRRT